MANEIWVEYKEDGMGWLRRFYRQKGETVEEFESRTFCETEALNAEENIKIVNVVKYA